MSDTLKAALAAALLFFGLGGASLLPGLGEVVPAVVPSAEDPPAAHQQAVAAVREALAGYPSGDKALWRDLWTQAGVVVAADTATPADFPTSTALRDFVIELLTAGWVTLGGHKRGENPKLDAAVNRAIADLVTDKEIGVTPELRIQFVAACKALAWAAK